MNANRASWLSAHGKLWYDDRWYRIAWILWPQALGLLLFVGLWLHHPGQGAIPWARPVLEAKKSPAPSPFKQQTTQPPLNQATDQLAPCKGKDYGSVISACTGLLQSGTLTGSNIAWAYWYRSWAYAQTKQYQLAMNDLDRAISIDPNESDFFNDRGNVWLEVGQNERALQAFNQAIQLKPNYSIPYGNRGIALYRLKQPDEALVALNKALELDPRQSLFYQYRAAIYESRSNWRGVYDDANKMIQYQPNNRLAYDYRGHAYFAVGQTQAAINDFSKAISLDPRVIYSWRMRGRAYYLMNQYDKAMSDFQAALRIDPNDRTTMDYINDLQRKQRGR